jgi:hypothetical protein
MFVLKSTYTALDKRYDDLVYRYDTLSIQHRSLIRQLNNLVDRINAKGGEAFLNGNTNKQLGKEDIRRLLQLCHPDKHNNSTLSQDMTQKLLKMKA